MFTPTPQQAEANELIKKWLANGGQEFYLAGYAGTGKTTLASKLGEHIGGGLHFVAFTNKAVFNLQQRGVSSASTIHRLIYKPVGDTELRELEEEIIRLTAEIQNTDEEKKPELVSLLADLEEQHKALKKKGKKLRFERRDYDDEMIRNIKLLIVDECSMLGAKILNDLRSFGVKTLYIGDPAQLPPVKDRAYFQNTTPDYTLTDIMRNAGGIVKVAHEIRQGQLVTPGRWGNCRITYPGGFSIDWDPDRQLIVWRNKTRAMYAQKFREQRGFWDDLPMEDDRIICRQNSRNNPAFLNGSMWRVVENKSCVGEVLTMDIKSEDTGLVYEDVRIYRDAFTNETGKGEVFNAGDEVEYFEWSYGLTAHSSQGSEWGNVTVLFEPGMMNIDEGRMWQSWLYTAVTRAKENLVLIYPNAFKYRDGFVKLKKEAA